MLGAANFLTTAWRADSHVPAHVVVVPSNYGHLGSRAHYRDRRTDTILTPPDPRIPLFNGVIAILWKRRVVDDGKNAAVANVGRNVYGLPTNYTTPRAASLNNRLPL